MSAFRKTRTRVAVRMAIAAMLLISTAASAQYGDGPIECDANANATIETEAQREQRVFCETHVGCRMVMATMRTTCRVKQFLQNLTTRPNPSQAVSNSDVADAATPNYPPSALANEAVATAKRSSFSPLRVKVDRQTVQSPDGTMFYAETQKDPKDQVGSRSVGVVVRADGTIIRGRFDTANGDYLNRGVYDGQAILPNGQMRAGSYIYGNGVDQGGPGVRSSAEADGRTSILEGTFDHGKPYDEMVRRFSDGTSRREFYRDGQLTMTGDLSAPGGIPPPLTRPRPPTPAYSIEMLEGLFLEADGPSHERYLLACNRQVIAVGEVGLKGKAPLPQPRECPNPEAYRKGLTDVVGPNWTARTEYWCDGRMVAATKWGPKSPQQYIRPQPTCSLPQNAHNRDEAAYLNAVKNTVRPGTIRPTDPDPLVVRGPPWPCSREIETFMAAWGRRTGGQGVLSPDAYWQRFGYSPVRVLLYATSAPTRDLHQQYIARTPNALSQPVVYTDYGIQYREGFFRSREEMQRLGNAFANNQARNPGGEVGGAMGIGACVARHLADNARN